MKTAERTVSIGFVTIAREDVWSAIQAIEYLMAQLRSDHEDAQPQYQAEYRRDYWAQARLRRRLVRASGY